MSAMHQRLRRSWMCLGLLVACAAHAAPDHVDITWLSIANVHFDAGRNHILADGYISRPPPEPFFGGGGGFANTHRAALPDAAAVRDVFDAMGGKSSINLILAG